MTMSLQYKEHSQSNDFFPVCGVWTYFHFDQIFKQLWLPLILTLGIDKYEKGVVGNTAISMGVVETFSMKSPP